MAKAAPKLIPTLPTMGRHAVLFIVGGVSLGLAFHYFGDQPVLKQAKEGLNGNVKGWFK